jgi:hypothetical protein
MQFHPHAQPIILKGSRVAVQYTERGKSVRDFMRADATGCGEEITAREWLERKHNLIDRHWGARGPSNQNQQLMFGK